MAVLRRLSVGGGGARNVVAVDGRGVGGRVGRERVVDGNGRVVGERVGCVQILRRTIGNRCGRGGRVQLELLLSAQPAVFVGDQNLVGVGAANRIKQYIMGRVGQGCRECASTLRLIGMVGRRRAGQLAAADRHCARHWRRYRSNVYVKRLGLGQLALIAQKILKRPFANGPRRQQRLAQLQP
ncbi:hypothetical protein BpHYR1_046949 [Brachionus plicatilis]|uniref:Uncharacterized protein n=1 Tax=Brachionus plicatilis TaxID=10195 RepID=A0A3M7PIQ8_BRAPC|nr:hypothetical protein BpHYR1_046949 [Brachionus plicatilis]